MRARTRTVLLLAAVAVLVTTTPRTAHAAMGALAETALTDSSRAPWHRVMHAQEIRALGLTRLADVVRFAQDWDETTYEDYTFDASPRGLTPPGQQGWTVLVDGRRVDLAVFGRVALNRLPVTLDRIERVEFIAAPMLHEGALEMRGVIHIHTHQPTEGPFLRGRIMAGSETGDPGPFRYLDARAPNVDRIGQQRELSGGYAGRGMYVEAALTDQLHYADDPVIERRYDTMSLEMREIDAVTGSLRLGWRGSRASHQILVGASEVDDPVHVLPLGREYPTDHRLLHASAGGGFALSRTTRLHYRASTTESRLGFVPNRRNLDFDWTQRDLRGSVDLRRSGTTRSTVLGIGAHRRRALTSTPLARDRTTVFRVYGETRWTGTPDKHALQFELATADGRIAVRGGWVMDWTMGTHDRLQTVFALVTRLPEEDGRLWYWQEQGYDLLSQANATAFTVPLETSAGLTADVGWSRALGRTLDGSVSAFSRLHWNDILEYHDWSYREFDRSVSAGTVMGQSDIWTVIGGTAEFRWRPTATLTHGLRYRYQHEVTGGRLSEAAWGTIPDHRLRLHTDWWITPGFAVGTRLRVRSESMWREFQQAERDSGGRIRAWIPAMALWDVTLQKTFWSDQLRGTVTFRNLLDVDDRTHAQGAVSGFAFVAALWASFGG